MASYKENKDFINNILPNNLLDDAIDWIKENLVPEDVFGDDIMYAWGKNWAEENGYEKPETL